MSNKLSLKEAVQEAIRKLDKTQQVKSQLIFFHLDGTLFTRLQNFAHYPEIKTVLELIAKDYKNEIDNGKNFVHYEARNPHEVFEALAKREE